MIYVSVVSMEYICILLFILQHKFIDVPNEKVILPSIYVVLMVSVGLMHIIPPETNKRKLPETLSEANAIRLVMILCCILSFNVA